MTNKMVERALKNARELANAPTLLKELKDMTTGELAALYRAAYGEPTRSRNKDYLRKRLAFRLQELKEGGLSAHALARITELGDELPERWRIRQAAKDKPVMPEVPRDPRLPPVGEVLRRVYQGATHEVVVGLDSFEYAGQRFKTLSAVAKHITGTAWNGFGFFGLKTSGEESVA